MQPAWSTEQNRTYAACCMLHTDADEHLKQQVALKKTNADAYKASKKGKVQSDPNCFATEGSGTIIGTILL